MSEKCDTCGYKPSVNFSVGSPIGILAICPECGGYRPFRELKEVLEYNE